MGGWGDLRVWVGEWVGRTMEEISSGAKVLVSPLKFTWMRGLPPGPWMTVKGQCCVRR